MTLIKKFRRDFDRLVRAEVAASWAGSLQDPDDHDDTMRELTLAKAQMKKTLDQVEEALNG